MTRSERIFKRFGSKKVFIVYAVCLFLTLATMLASIITTLVAGSQTTEKMIEHIAICVLAVILLNIPNVMRSRFSFHIPAFIQITVEIFIIAHFVLGEIYRFYDYIFLFDKMLHTTAGIIIAILGFSIVYGFAQTESGAIKLSPFFVALFSFCFSLALLTLWEVFEYLMDCFFVTNMQRWQDGITVEELDGVLHYFTTTGQGSGLIDTMSDIIVGTIGAAIISVACGFAVAKNPSGRKFFITKANRQ